MISKRDIQKYYDLTESEYRIAVYSKNSFNKHFGIWDNTTKNYEEAVLRSNVLVSKLGKINKNSKVLDAGCGVGGSSIWLAKNKGCNVVGLTLSKNELKISRENAIKNKVDDRVKFFLMDYTKTKFKKKSFDVVFGIESVCHAYDKKKFIKEAHRLLKNGGRVVIVDGFQGKKKLNKREEKIVSDFCHGWAVESLSTFENFHRLLLEQNFREIRFMDKTKNIIKTSKRFYHFALLLSPLVLFYYLGILSKIRKDNLMSGFHQYHGIKRGILSYGIFSAKK